MKRQWHCKSDSDWQEAAAATTCYQVKSVELSIVDYGEAVTTDVHGRFLVDMSVIVYNRWIDAISTEENGRVLYQSRTEIYNDKFS